MPSVRITYLCGCKSNLACGEHGPKVEDIVEAQAELCPECYDKAIDAMAEKAIADVDNWIEEEEKKLCARG